MQDREEVPRYFSDFQADFGKFREDNAKEHGVLAEKIAQSESRLTWRMAGALAVGLSLTIAALTFVIVYLD